MYSQQHLSLKVLKWKYHPKRIWCKDLWTLDPKVINVINSTNAIALSPILLDFQLHGSWFFFLKKEKSGKALLSHVD